MLWTMLLLLVASNLLLSVHGRTLVPCYFIFGDSLLDNGNNNGRATVAKANYPPYGVDFPGGPTGRFTNGRNIADFIAESLGFTNHIPPFANASGNAFLNGVNYASGGAGILRTTGKQLGDVISLDKQLQNHQITIGKVTAALGDAGIALKYLSQCIYSVGMGSNDYLGYALSPVKATPSLFASQLIGVYSRQLTQLYKLGAKKVAVFGLGTIGCVPTALRGTSYGPACLAATQATSGIFNNNLKSLVDTLNKKLAGAKFTYINTYGILVSDPSSKRFAFRSVPCCTMREAPLCAPNSTICSDRSEFAFFDGVHPTEAAVEIAAKRAFAAHSHSDAYPYDIKHLALESC